MHVNGMVLPDSRWYATGEPRRLRMRLPRRSERTAADLVTGDMTVEAVAQRLLSTSSLVDVDIMVDPAPEPTLVDAERWVVIDASTFVEWNRMVDARIALAGRIRDLNAAIDAAGLGNAFTGGAIDQLYEQVFMCGHCGWDASRSRGVSATCQRCGWSP